MLIANYNNDLGRILGVLGYGFVPIDLSNEAYKFGVNYIIYGMTHCKLWICGFGRDWDSDHARIDTESFERSSSMEAVDAD